MRISWFFGFGWVSILTVAACGLGISYLGGPLGWALYVPFLIVAVYMTARFRLYNTQPWRRVHGRAMIAYSKLAGREYDVDATARGEVAAMVLPAPAIAELTATAPDLMLTLMSRLVTGAFDHLDWVTRALVSPS